MMNRSFRKDVVKNEKKEDEKGVSPVIAVILMVAITVVLAGVLWAMLQGLGDTKTPNERLTAIVSEKSFGWQVTISSGSSNDLNLEDIEFQLITDEGPTEYRVTINNANPGKFIDGESVVYAMTKGTAVIDNQTSNQVNEDSRFEDYEGCYIAYIDQNADTKVTSGDTIYVYKDYDNDGIEEILSRYKLKITVDSETALEKTL